LSGFNGLDDSILFGVNWQAAPPTDLDAFMVSGRPLCTTCCCCSRCPLPPSPSAPPIHVHPRPPSGKSPGICLECCPLAALTSFTYTHSTISWSCSHR
jgi:hypothetical protein